MAIFPNASILPTGARLPVAQAAGDEVKKQIQVQHGLGRARRYRRDVAVACQRGQNEPERGAGDIYGEDNPGKGADAQRRQQGLRLAGFAVAGAPGAAHDVSRRVVVAEGGVADFAGSAIAAGENEVAVVRTCSRFRDEVGAMRVGMGCKAQNAGNVGYLAKFCNAADRPIPRTSRPSRDFEQVLATDRGRATGCGC